jgi:hypothetical protein
MASQTPTTTVEKDEEAAAVEASSTTPTLATKPSDAGRAASVANDPSLPRAVVLRRLLSSRTYEPGEVIEVPGRRRDVLIRNRQLRELNYGERIYRCRCGQLWIDEQQAKSHNCGAGTS